jgi:hypothetical protein
VLEKFSCPQVGFEIESEMRSTYLICICMLCSTIYNVEFMNVQYSWCVWCVSIMNEYEYERKIILLLLS